MGKDRQESGLKEIESFSAMCKRIRAEIGKDIVGQNAVVEGVIIAMIAGGNVLLEGVPGTGKTRLIRSIGRVFGLPFSRIQFTPDLMPADVTGTNIIEKDEKGNSVYRFAPGPIFSSIVLADEINRATPKTQSALLEAMEEHRVSVAGTDYPLEEPFFVLATQNPVEQEGTYPLPEAQVDRFMFKLNMAYPRVQELYDIVVLTQKTKEEHAEQVIDAETLLQMRKTAQDILVSDDVLYYAMRVVSATQPESETAGETAKNYIAMGASPRAAQALITAAKIRALISGRYNIAVEDIDALAPAVLRHRIKLNFDALALRKTADGLIAEILAQVKKNTKHHAEKA